MMPFLGYSIMAVDSLAINHTPDSFFLSFTTRSAAASWGKITQNIATNKM